MTVHRIHEIDGMQFRDPTPAEGAQLACECASPAQAFSDLRMLLAGGTAPLELTIRPERALSMRTALVGLTQADSVPDAPPDASDPDTE